MKWSQKADPRVVDAVLSVFSQPDDDLYACLLPLSSRQWEQSLYWLDASGTALYLLERLENLDLLGTLPHQVRRRLGQNLKDNRMRSACMLDEFLEINQAFQAAGVVYCALKGFTLAPISCPDPALRIQLDLDFHVESKDLPACQQILAGRGYVLRTQTGRTWEFKTESLTLAEISELYKPREQRSIELHFGDPSESAERNGSYEHLHGLEWIEIQGQKIPVLCSVDQFIAQATHICSHLCGSSTRLAWLLELGNHLRFRFHDVAFWDRVVSRARLAGDTWIRVGVACLAVEEVLDCSIPRTLETGLVGRMPAGVRLWVERYAARAVLADSPGTKLHLFLQEEVHHHGAGRDTARPRVPFPCRRPPKIFTLPAGASLGERVQGELYQVRYELFRARFHVVQGLAYLMEVPRWRKALRTTQSAPPPDTLLRAQAVQPQ